MKNVAIIVIGDEILLGRVTDTNSGFIARAVDATGAKTTSIRTVGDNAEAIRNALTDALDTADIIFTTGGLGPTKDDITKRILTDFFGGELIRNSDVTANIERIFADRKLKLNELTLNQALVPSSAEIIQNRLGTAPIMVFRKDGKIIIALPGVPYEMEGMLPEVFKYLSKNEFTAESIRHATFVVTGVSESALAQYLDSFEGALPQHYKLAYLPDSPIIKLRLDCYGNSDDFERHRQNLLDILESTPGLAILGEGEKSLAQLVVECLEKKSLTLSVAESCTGGNIAHLITSVSGASAIFNGGVVSYANSAKIDVLGVGPETLETNGAVSRPVVIQMVEGVSRIMSTDCALATSGIAGPTGGTPNKPVGTVWIAVKTPGGIFAECYRFPGNRDRVIARATSTALILLLRSL